MPYPQIMNTTIDTSVCGADHSVTAYYEVLHDRVYDVGDAFNGSICIICPVLNTDYQLFYSICSDYCQELPRWDDHVQRQGGRFLVQ